VDEYDATIKRQRLEERPQTGLEVRGKFFKPQSSWEAILKRRGQLKGGFKMAEKKFNKDMVIGDVLKANPGAIKVIEKYFGQGCFTCPGMKMESISFGAMMHNIDPEVIVKELNTLD
jgi:hybrid cluster-associated redox disulfide protein